MRLALAANRVMRRRAAPSRSRSGLAGSELESGIGRRQAVQPAHRRDRRAHRETDHLGEPLVAIAHDLTVRPALLDIDQHESQSGNDLLAPEKQIQPVRDPVGLALIDVGQAPFRTADAVPKITVAIQIDVVVTLMRTVDIAVVQADQLVGAGELCV